MNLNKLFSSLFYPTPSSENRLFKWLASSCTLHRGPFRYKNEIPPSEDGHHFCAKVSTERPLPTPYSIIIRNSTPSSPPFSALFSTLLYPCTRPCSYPTAMDKMVSFDAILFPADERAPHLVSLMTSNASSFQHHGHPASLQPLSAMAKVPHPEMYMDFIAEGVGARAWRHHVSSLPSVCLLLVSNHPRRLHSLHSNFFSFFIPSSVRPARSQNGGGDDHPLPRLSISFPISLILIRRS